jgi:hypothetical protein
MEIFFTIFLFVKINCAALPETLLQSELYGYEKGTFSGEDKNHGQTLCIPLAGKCTAAGKYRKKTGLQPGWKRIDPVHPQAGWGGTNPMQPGC